MYTINARTKIIEEVGITNDKQVFCCSLVPKRTQGTKIQFKVIYHMQHYPIDLLFFQSGSLLGL